MRLWRPVAEISRCLKQNNKPLIRWNHPSVLQLCWFRFRRSVPHFLLAICHRRRPASADGQPPLIKGGRWDKMRLSITSASRLLSLMVHLCFQPVCNDILTITWQLGLFRFACFAVLGHASPCKLRLGRKSVVFFIASLVFGWLEIILVLFDYFISDSRYEVVLFIECGLEWVAVHYYRAARVRLISLLETKLHRYRASGFSFNNLENSGKWHITVIAAYGAAIILHASLQFPEPRLDNKNTFPHQFSGSMRKITRWVSRLSFWGGPESGRAIWCHVRSERCRVWPARMKLIS